MNELEDAVRRVARATGFSGAVRVDRAGEVELAVAFGDADRAHGIPNTVDTVFGVASGAKGFTALTIAALIEDGALALDTPARDVLGADLPEIDDRVTIEQLLAHRSGIGDYLDEERDADIDDYAMAVPVQDLATSDDYLAILGGHPQAFPPDERFAYCNGGFVVLGVIAERVAGVPFHELVVDRVCRPAGMARTAFLRSDELPGDAALGYVTMDGHVRTNVFHLPVRGGGDGGIYTTLADMVTFWDALGAGRIVSPSMVAAMHHPRSQASDDPRRYGLGFWLHATSDVVMLEGYDAGVSFRSAHDPTRDLTHTVVSNTSPGAWPMTRAVEETLGTRRTGGHTAPLREQTGHRMTGSEAHDAGAGSVIVADRGQEDVMDCKLELVALPVADVDQAIGFYVETVGWHLDHDHRVSDEIRFVQVTPPGSACSIAIGKGLIRGEQGPIRTLQVVVPDIEEAHADLTARGVAVSAIEDLPWGSFVYFDDPDGNAWSVQSVQARPAS